MADDAMKSRNIQINPRRVTRAQIVELYKQVGQFDDDWDDDDD